MLATLWCTEILELGPWSSRHACGANMARLNECRSLNPRPPLSLGSFIFSQPTQCIFFSSFCCNHQYVLAYHITQLFTKTLREVKTTHSICRDCLAADLTMISLPCIERKCSNQPCILAHSRSFIYSKHCVTDQPIYKGWPSYFPF